MELDEALKMGKPFKGFTIPSGLTREEKMEFIRQRMDEARLIVLPTLIIVHGWSEGVPDKVTRYDDVTPIKAYQIASMYDNKDVLYDYMCQYMVTDNKSDNVVFVASVHT